MLLLQEKHAPAGYGIFRYVYECARQGDDPYSGMLQNHLLKFLGRGLVGLGDLLTGQHLHRRKSLALRSIRHKEKYQGRAYEARQGGGYEAGLPAQPSDNKRQHIVRYELSDIWTRTEKTVVRTSLGLREPS